jgi:hypothetical protein
LFQAPRMDLAYRSEAVNGFMEVIYFLYRHIEKANFLYRN